MELLTSIWMELTAAAIGLGAFVVAQWRGMTKAARIALAVTAGVIVLMVVF